MVSDNPNGSQSGNLTFAGWYAYGASKIWDFKNDLAGESGAMYASWKQGEGNYYYPVVFKDVKDGQTCQYCVLSGCELTLTPVKEGYEFAYWEVDAGNNKGKQWEGKVLGPTYLRPVWTKQ